MVVYFPTKLETRFGFLVHGPYDTTASRSHIEDNEWNNDLIKESLADNITDIYQDMKDFVVLFQDSRLAAKENAVADLKRLFAVHWGLRATKAAYKIHLTLFNNEIADDYLNL